MIQRAMIEKWSRAPEGSDRYLRPLIARGPLLRRGAVVVGLNPATEIGPKDIPFDEYVDLLLDLDRFTNFYRDLRIKRRKKPTSPTRTGLNGIAEWLSKLGWKSVIDTNISPYPTASGEELKLVPLHLQSRDIFHEILNSLAPRLIILHGKEALKEFTTRIAPELTPPVDATFSSLVANSPHLGQINWQHGEVCDVFVCSHLRFFSNTRGIRFAALKMALSQGPHHEP